MSTKVYNVEPAEIDLEFIKGDSIDLSFSVKKNNSSFDMTGMDVKMQIRDTTIDSALIKTLEIGNGITVSTDTILIASEGFVESGRYLYDLQVEVDSKIYTIMQGNLIVNQETTI